MKAKTGWNLQIFAMGALLAVCQDTANATPCSPREIQAFRLSVRHLREGYRTLDRRFMNGDPIGMMIQGGQSIGRAWDRAMGTRGPLTAREHLNRAQQQIRELDQKILIATRTTNCAEHSMHIRNRARQIRSTLSRAQSALTSGGETAVKGLAGTALVAGTIASGGGALFGAPAITIAAGSGLVVAGGTVLNEGTSQPQTRDPQTRPRDGYMVEVEIERPLVAPPAPPIPTVTETPAPPVRRPRPRRRPTPRPIPAEPTHAIAPASESPSEPQTTAETPSTEPAPTSQESQVSPEVTPQTETQVQVAPVPEETTATEPQPQTEPATTDSAPDADAIARLLERAESAVTSLPCEDHNRAAYRYNVSQYQSDSRHADTVFIAQSRLFGCKVRDDRVSSTANTALSEAQLFLAFFNLRLSAILENINVTVPEILAALSEIENYAHVLASSERAVAPAELQNFITEFSRATQTLRPVLEQAQDIDGHLDRGDLVAVGGAYLSARRGLIRGVCPWLAQVEATHPESTRGFADGSGIFFPSLCGQSRFRAQVPSVIPQPQPTPPSVVPPVTPPEEVTSPAEIPPAVVPVPEPVTELVPT